MSGNGEDGCNITNMNDDGEDGCDIYKEWRIWMARRKRMDGNITDMDHDGEDGCDI